jgi:hypothetical protein
LHEILIGHLEEEIEAFQGAFQAVCPVVLVRIDGKFGFVIIALIIIQQAQGEIA